MGGTIDRAPNRETGDRCAHPQARTQTLVQSRVEVGNLAWISSFVVDGAIGVAGVAGDAIDHATSLCRSDASNVGISNTADIFAWLSTTQILQGRGSPALTRTPDRSMT